MLATRFSNGVLKAKKVKYRFAPSGKHFNRLARVKLLFVPFVSRLERNETESINCSDCVISSTKKMQDHLQELACFGERPVFLYLLITVVWRKLGGMPRPGFVSTCASFLRQVSDQRTGPALDRSALCLVDGEELGGPGARTARPFC